MKKIQQTKEKTLESLEVRKEMAKRELERHVKTLAKFSFIEHSGNAVYFQEKYRVSFKTCNDVIDKSKLDKKGKEELRFKFWGGEVCPKGEDMNLWTARQDVEYYESLARFAECELKNIHYDKKVEIVMEGLKQMKHWSNAFDRASKIYEELEKKKEKSKKRTGVKQ